MFCHTPVTARTKGTRCKKHTACLPWLPSYDMMSLITVFIVLLFDSANPKGFIQNFFGPAAVRLKYPKGPEPVYTAVLFNGFFVVNMQGDVIEVRHFLGQTGFSSALDFFLVALAVYDLVDFDAVSLEKGADILLRAKGRGIDPDFKALSLAGYDPILVQRIVNGMVRDD